MASYDLDRELQAGSVHFPVRVRSGVTGWDELARELAGLEADLYVIVTDRAVPEGLARRVGGLRLRVPGGATLQTVERLAERIVQGGATRRTVLVAVGGEELGAAAGVLAALLFQGVRLVRVPTSLGALCGEALSLSRRLPAEMLGLHHAPTLVWGQLDLLAEEPADELRAGLTTVVRHVLAVCPAHYDRLAAVLNPEAAYGPRELAAFVALCVDARAAVVAYDPLERGPARALAYGRSLGRAVRALTGEALRPGCADALGLLAAARIAAHLGLLDAADERAHQELLLRAGLPVALPVVLPAGVDPAALPAAVRAALAVGGEDGLLLLAGLGRPHVADGSLLTRVGADTLRAGLEVLRPGQQGGVPGRVPGAVPGSRTAPVLAPADR
ncbi:3-dehydroquinate synthase family protein [Kitasatospora sp. McL0602]|uniref:3-dehydroquinate synthase family protein n=1 Tax=Kitasatospora sp. McL0602 TaxID=3439530 RepID=UPI003F89F6AA